MCVCYFTYLQLVKIFVSDRSSNTFGGRGRGSYRGNRSGRESTSTCNFTTEKDDWSGCKVTPKTETREDDWGSTAAKNKNKFDDDDWGTPRQSEHKGQHRDDNRVNENRNNSHSRGNQGKRFKPREKDEEDSWSSNRNSGGWNKSRRGTPHLSENRRRTPLSTASFANRRRRETPVNKKKEFVSVGTNAPYWGPGLGKTFENVHFQNKLGLSMDHVFTVLTDVPSGSLGKPYPNIMESVDPREADQALIANAKARRKVLVMANNKVEPPETRKFATNWHSMSITVRNIVSNSSEINGIKARPIHSAKNKETTNVGNSVGVTEESKKKIQDIITVPNTTPSFAEMTGKMTELILSIEEKKFADVKSEVAMNEEPKKVQDIRAANDPSPGSEEMGKRVTGTGLTLLVEGENANNVPTAVEVNQQLEKIIEDIVTVPLSVSSPSSEKAGRISPAEQSMEIDDKGAVEVDEESEKIVEEIIPVPNPVSSPNSEEKTEEKSETISPAEQINETDDKGAVEVDEDSEKLVQDEINSNTPITVPPTDIPKPDFADEIEENP